MLKLGSMHVSTPAVPALGNGLGAIYFDKSKLPFRCVVFVRFEATNVLI